MGEINGSSNWGWRQFTGVLVIALVTVAGWYVGDRLSARQDFENDRRQLRTEYLLETYRHIAEAGIHGEKADEEVLRNQEVAVLDVQILGTNEQIQLLHEIPGTKGKDRDEAWRKLLSALRDELRAEFRMPRAREGFLFLNLRSAPSTVGESGVPS